MIVVSGTGTGTGGTGSGGTGTGTGTGSTGTQTGTFFTLSGFLPGMNMQLYAKKKLFSNAELFSCWLKYYLGYIKFDGPYCFSYSMESRLVIIIKVVKLTKEFYVNLKFQSINIIAGSSFLNHNF